MRDIIGEFIQQKNQRHPISGQPLSKVKRMDEMYKIATNNVFGVKYSKDERILAVEFIKQILQED